MSLYTELKESGAEIGNRESDLHVKATAKVLDILTSEDHYHTKWEVFFVEIDGSRWIEVPFAYDPWWEDRS